MTDPDEPICSAKGCTSPAVWALLWNNPKLHTPDRRKTWLACDEHRGSLSDFLGARGFLKDVVPGGGADRVAASQPPMADIGRSGWRNDGSSIPWPARLPAIAATQRTARSSSEAPARRAPRRSDSSRAKRQLRT